MELLTAVGLVTVKAVMLSMAIVASSDKIANAVCTCTNDGVTCIELKQ